MAELERDGARLFYEHLGGSGPLCLVVHGGLGLDHTYLRPTFDALGARLSVAYPDLRGNGRSSRPPLDSLTMELWADDLVALADHLGADRFLVMGHSYGGFVAQELAIRHPDRLLGAVLLCTTPGQLGETEPPDAPQGDPPTEDQVALMAAPLSSDAEMAEVMAQLVPYYLHAADPAELHALMARTIYAHETMVRGFAVLSQWSSYDRLSGVADLPVLVVGGRHDSFTSAEQSERIGRALPGAEVRIFEHSGHFPWLDEPSAFWSCLEAWLGRHAELQS